jgi:hypothetical protein
MQSLKERPDATRDLELELANREHNLSVIEETIRRDPKTGARLYEVRDLLVRRITTLRIKLAERSRNARFETIPN